MRWMEKQEARSLRMALEDMDLEEERRVHAAARDEAAELVWKHKFPQEAAQAVFANPDLQEMTQKKEKRSSQDYRQHLQRGSYQRSHGSSGEERSVSSSSSSEGATGKQRYSQHRKVSPPSGIVNITKRRESGSKSYAPLAEAVAKDIAVAHRRSSSGSVRILSGEKKMFMHPNDKIWEDPSEEPAEMPPTRPIREPVRIQHARPIELPPIPSLLPTTSAPVRKNPFARVRAQHDAAKLGRANSAPLLQTLPHAPIPVLRHDRVEIQRNPPSQSRNPWYVSNEPLPPTPPPEQSGRDDDEVAPKTATPTRRRSEEDDDVEEIRTKNGKEVRGDDIRAATGKSRKDYSPNLPRPTMVSAKPGRPIVSFEKKREVVLEEQKSATREVMLEEQKSATREVPAVADREPIHSVPTISFPNQQPTPKINLPAEHPQRSTLGFAGKLSSVPTISFPDEQPAIPTINFPDEQPTIPSVNFPDDQSPIPSINFPDNDTNPSINMQPTHRSNMQSSPSHASRPLPPQPARPLPQHTATTGSPSGRSTPHYTPSLRAIPTGALCTHCALPIAGRILSAAGSRFHPGCFVCHTCGTNLECVAFYPEPDAAKEERGMKEEEGDVRFFCHLDFHEHFSPRCKSCKTPIESGEVIQACGGTWHPGHFFCAQCGDPFDSTKPFVEREGYAWCVGCHSTRTAVKCRGCKKGIMDVVVKAVGSDWHEACFRCGECQGGFADGRYFLREESGEEVVVCVGCEERRLKG